MLRTRRLCAIVAMCSGCYGMKTKFRAVENVGGERCNALSRRCEEGEEGRLLPRDIFSCVSTRLKQTPN